MAKNSQNETILIWDYFWSSLQSCCNIDKDNRQISITIGYLWHERVKIDWATIWLWGQYRQWPKKVDLSSFCFNIISKTFWGVSGGTNRQIKQIRAANWHLKHKREKLDWSSMIFFGSIQTMAENGQNEFFYFRFYCNFRIIF